MICLEFRRSTTICGRSSAVPGPPLYLLIALTTAALSFSPGTMPPRGRLYSLSAPERGLWRTTLQSPLAAGIIVPSSSPAGAGFFFVKKKDGSLRPCIDYRGVERHNSQESLSFGLLCRQPSRSYRAQRFSQSLTCVMPTTWYVLRKETSGRPRLNTPIGHFEYRVLPFGASQRSRCVSGFSK